MPHEKLRPSFTIDEEKLSQLKQVIPEAFADGKINWEVLKEALGERLEEEGVEAEHFGLFWPGKREALRIASIPSKGTLVPAKGEGIDEDETKNIFIEGENLEVLKLLQKSYAGKIKMIYIDPPYNTGNDFIYDDNFTEPLEEYLKYTGQMDEEGRLLTTNKKADGRFHSKWLSMMYPRLRLARNLLSEDGVIFISIDDNEVAHLKKICDEIFGEENFVAQLVWRKKYGGGKGSSYFVDLHEYVLCYLKNMSAVEGFSVPRTDDQKEIFDQKDEYYKERGGYYIRPLKSGLAERKTLVYGIKCPDGSTITTQWICSKDTYEKMLAEGRIVFKKLRDGTYNVYKKFYEKDGGGDVLPESIIYDLAYNQNGKEEIKELFEIKEGRDVPFENAKPTKLIKHFLSIGASDDSIVLDFFAGSASTAHAVLSCNLDTTSNINFIMIQLPELIEESSAARKMGYKNIADIGKDRLRRAIKKEKLKDGFKVFVLDKSNFKQWHDYEGKDLKEVEGLFKKWESPLTDDWKEENLLVEIMLQEGFPLDSAIQILKDHKKNKVVEVSSEFCEHKLLVNLDKKIDEETITNLNLAGKDIFVCLDIALTDEQKIKLDDKGFLKTI